MLRVGIAGWGEIARFHARHLVSHPSVRLEGVLSRSRRDLEWPVFSRLEELLERVDALTVALPNQLHAAVAEAAIRAGKGVLIEKPLCIETHELERLRRVAEARLRAPFHLGYRLRWSPQLIRLKGAVSRPSRIRVSYRTGIERLGFPAKPWIGRRDCSGGAFCVLAPHALDLARWLAGARGRRLLDLEAGARQHEPAADFPLLVDLRGALPAGPVIEVQADMRGGAAYRLSVQVKEAAGWREVVLEGQSPGEREEQEYRGLVHNFVEACLESRVDRDELREIMATHEDLFRARGEL